MGVRKDLFTAVNAALTTASLTASDASSSSITVTIKGEYNNNSDKRNLPVVTVSKVTVPTTGTFAFGTGVLSEREPRIMIDIYGQRVPHVEMIADQIDDYIKITDDPFDGFMLIGMDEDDELSTPNANKAHHKTLFLTFNKWVR